MKRSKWWGQFLGVLVASSVGSGALAVKPEECYQNYWRGNYEKALVACTELSQQKDGLAYYYLGQMYENGWGVAQDETQAIKHFKASADLGVNN